MTSISVSAVNPMGMAYRDLTRHFRELRNGFKRDSNSSGDSQTDYTTQPLTQSTAEETKFSIEMQRSPVWSETLMSMDHAVEEIEKQIAMLIEFHSLRSRILFEDRKSLELDANIQETTMAVTSMFKRCKTLLKKIGDIGSDSDLGYEERAIRFNIMRSRALRIQDLTTKFRRAQREYLQQIKAKEDRSSAHFDGDNVMSVINLDRVQQGMDESQLQELHHMEQNADQRTKDIIQIAKSVHELAQLFEELSVLVYEQGSLLDRIDYNVEQAVEQLESAKGHIDKAEEHQKKSRTALCILVLIVIIIIAGVILILRNI